MEFLSENSVMILSALLAVSEVLGLIPQLKANSIFQLVVSGIKALYGFVSKPKELPKQ